MLEFNPKIKKFSAYVIDANGFSKNHDIKGDVQEEDGRLIALTLRVTNLGTLGMSEEEFEQSGEPMVLVKCDYEHHPANGLYRMARSAVMFFDKHKDEENRQYYAMHGAYAKEVTKEEFDDIHHNFG